MGGWCMIRKLGAGVGLVVLRLFFDCFFFGCLISEGVGYSTFRLCPAGTQAGCLV